MERFVVSTISRDGSVIRWDIPAVVRRHHRQEMLKPFLIHGLTITITGLFTLGIGFISSVATTTRVMIHLAHSPAVEAALIVIVAFIVP